MALRVVNVGEQLLLKRALNHTAADDVKLHLYTNDVTPSESHTVANYTEATGNGYSEIELTGSSFTVATSDGVTTASYTEQTFTFTGGPVSVYGYYVTDGAGTTLLWAERFTSAPYNIPADGGEIRITIRLTGE